jgi:hypothetical protein
MFSLTPAFVSKEFAIFHQPLDEGPRDFSVSLVFTTCSR